MSHSSNNLSFFMLQRYSLQPQNFRPRYSDDYKVVKFGTETITYRGIKKCVMRHSLTCIHIEFANIYAGFMFYLIN